ncbi:MAG: aminopeptidase P family protein [Chloroflexi bacterium]|nr:aminopeptidase P family protein [Chloroflexota bacterium]
MPLTTTQLKISDAEYAQRNECLLEFIDELDVTGLVLFDADYIKYYTGFAFIPTERPMAYVISRAGERALFVPRLELEHAQSMSIIDRVAHYSEYPDLNHPMNALVDLLKDTGVNGRIGADSDGYPWIFGYRGETLSKLTGSEVLNCRAPIEDQMMVKSEAEITLLKESCKWGNLAHTLLQKYTAVGIGEVEVSQRASDEATLMMLETIGPIWRGNSAWFTGAIAGYRGQIGRNAAIPHALTSNIKFQAGDVLVTGASAAVWGYVSELERTMILGQPSDEQKRFFGHMLNLQTIAMEALEPGKPCSEVDREVRAYFDAHDLMTHWKHHSGHTIGLRYHEGPFLDIGDDTPIEAGMVFTVEPGLYVPELGGFRHSDTVLVTEDGAEMLTYYPRDLESLTIPI